MNAALQSVAAERARQVNVRGYSVEHDDAHDKGELALAAASYALYAHMDHTPKDAALFQVVGKPGHPIGPRHLRYHLWPWAKDQFKTGRGRRRDLVKAAALLIAEIERVDRLEERAKQDPV